MLGNIITLISGTRLVTKLCFVTLICVFITAYYFSKSGETEAYILFRDVGQGLSVYIYDSGHLFVIDGGPTYITTVSYSQDLCFLDGLLLTHPHADHLTGVTRLLNLCLTKTLYFNPLDYSSFGYLSFIKQASKHKTSGAYRGDLIEFGSFNLYVLGPSVNTDANRDVNESSIVLLLDRGSFEALLTADISAATQEELPLAKYVDEIQGGVDLYLVPHHGSELSYDKDFLAWLKPKVAIVSVGDNDYGHPSPKFEAYFSDMNIPYLRTDVHGDIRINLKEMLQPQ